jgi:deoxyribonuclease-4
MGVYQIYLGSRQMYDRRQVPDHDVKKTLSLLNRFPIRVFSHAALIYNLSKYIPAVSQLVSELDTMARLKSGMVIHVGKHPDPEDGLKKVVKNINILLNIKTLHPKQKRMIILENAAGQGWVKKGGNKELGSTINELKFLQKNVDKSDQIKFCIDTQHLFARGEYPIHTVAGVREFLDSFDASIGLDRIACFHLNDSLTSFGSRVDRHASLGTGQIYSDQYSSLATLLSRMPDIPFISETGNAILDRMYIDFITGLK